MGLELPHPFIAGASPLADSVVTARQMEDGGVAAIVMRSLFQEQLTVEAMATHYAIESHTNTFSEATSYFPDHEDFVLGPDEYLAQIELLKAALEIPVIASLNGTSPGGWLQYARLIERAGADALELNIYEVVTDPDRSGASLEDDVVEMVRLMRSQVGIPIAVKLSPFYTALPSVARRIVDAGADGLVLFNRVFGPDVDVEELELRARMELSTPAELSLRLRWLALLAGRTLPASLAISGGVHEPLHAIKAIMCGADAVQLVSALLNKGPRHVLMMCNQVTAWLEDEEYESLSQMRGSMSWQRCPNPDALSRSNYLHLLRTWRPESPDAGA
jgi:dihydroorotate dehydrogenase (fumarate)